MYKTTVDRRRPLHPPVGLAREHATATPAADLMPTLQRPGARAWLVADPTQLPAPEDREGYYGDRHLDYWLSGLRDWHALRDLLPRPRLGAGAAPRRYFDMGGSTGRVARHATAEEGLEVWLSDININWVDWIDRYFAKPIRAYQSRLFPFIPVPDGHFDLVSAFSVFTHLDCDQRQWLLELLRVTRPGGRLYLTVNDEHVWGLLRDPAWEWLRRSFSRGREEERFAQLVQAAMPSERFVWEYSDAEGYNINIFLDSAQLRRDWGRFAEVEDYRVAGHNYQSVVVLRKPG